MKLVAGPATEVVDALTRLVLSARREYLGLDDPSPRVRAGVPDGAVACRSHTMRSLADRGVHIRRVTTPTGMAGHDDPGAPPCRCAGEVRVVDRLPVQACVIDRRLALVPADLAVPANGTLVVTDPVVVAVVVSVHRWLWQRARPPGAAVVGGAPPHLRPVLTMLASGLSDARAAQRGGLAARTYSRRVAELLQVLGSGSRFAAGAEAVRRGWV